MRREMGCSGGRGAWGVHLLEGSSAESSPWLRVLLARGGQLQQWRGIVLAVGSAGPGHVAPTSGFWSS